MGLGGSLVVETAALAALSVSSLPGIHLCPGIHRRPVGPGRGILGDGSLEADVHGVVGGGPLKNASCMAAASSATDEVNATPRR